MTEAARSSTAGDPPAADALAWVDAHRAGFGWSTRAWARPWRDFVREHPGLRVGDALELGAGPRSSLAPLLLGLAERVECSVHDGAALPAVRALNAGLLDAAQHARVHYAERDLRTLEGRWDLIAMKSVLGGVYRQHDARLADVHAALARLVEHNLKPGGWLLTLDNGRTALAPLLARRGARRNGWRLFARADLPPPAAHYGFGVLGMGSAATRWGALGARIDDLLYGGDLLLTPLARQHAVHLNVYRRPS